MIVIGSKVKRTNNYSQWEVIRIDYTFCLLKLTKEIDAIINPVTDGWLCGNNSEETCKYFRLESDVRYLWVTTDRLELI